MRTAGRAARAAAIIGLGAAVAGPATADGWTFRRVGLPQAGSTDRIDVQIDPNAPRRVAARAPRLPPPPSPAGVPHPEPAAVAWFWAGVSPRLADGGPGRLEAALRVMADAPEPMAAPRLQALQDIARAHGPDILRATVGTRVSPALALAVIAVESGGRTGAVSPAGAAGLMQLMPATAARFGVTDGTAAADNIRGGVAYLDWLLGRFGGDPVLALAGYNAGEGAVDDAAGVPPYAETRAYVPKVLAAWTVARGLCLTPPELASDGCVFAVDAAL